MKTINAKMTKIITIIIETSGKLRLGRVIETATFALLVMLLCGAAGAVRAATLTVTNTKQREQH